MLETLRVCKDAYIFIMFLLLNLREYKYRTLLILKHGKDTSGIIVLLSETLKTNGIIYCQMSGNVCS